MIHFTSLTIFRQVMDQVEDLQELVKLSEDQLESVLGNDANAKVLWSFLHTQLKKVDSGNKAKNKQ